MSAPTHEMRLIEPTTVAEATSIVCQQANDAVYVGGGTALVLLLKLGLLAPRILVSLRSVEDLPGWRAIVPRDGRLIVGGGVTLSDVAASTDVRRYAPSLAKAAALVGNLRVRNVATIGGALAEADYAADPPAPLVSVSGEVIVHDGIEPRAVPASEFFQDFYTTALGEGELVSSVSIPMPFEDSRSTYLKFASRSAEDRPCVGVAATGRFDGNVVRALRVVVGAVAGVPQCLSEVTAPAVGEVLDEPSARAIADGYAELIDPIEDIRGSSWYRREVIRAQVYRALEEIGPAWGAA